MNYIKSGNVNNKRYEFNKVETDHPRRSTTDDSGNCVRVIRNKQKNERLNCSIRFEKNT